MQNILLSISAINEVRLAAAEQHTRFVSIKLLHFNFKSRVYVHHIQAPAVLFLNFPIIQAKYVIQRTRKATMSLLITGSLPKLV